MTLLTRRILRIELTVSNLDQAERFYVDTLGFTLLHRGDVDPAFAALLGADRVTATELRRGQQTLVLQAFEPSGQQYPHDAVASDQLFQHFALPVVDMPADYARLSRTNSRPISQGPQLLPKRSGGATAYKFRDLDLHPLELLRFPDGRSGGIDHSAIVVMDAERSIAFYRDQLGFSVAARQTNTGDEQDRLDGLPQVEVDVVALNPQDPTPHLELLGYRHPVVRPVIRLHPNDVAATRLVLEVDRPAPDATPLLNGMTAALIHDPDEHALLLIARS